MGSPNDLVDAYPYGKQNIKPPSMPGGSETVTANGYKPNDPYAPDVPQQLHSTAAAGYTRPQDPRAWSPIDDVPNQQNGLAQYGYTDVGPSRGFSANRARGFGDYAAGVYRNQLDNAAAARGSQQDALGMMRSAAQGNAPSRAEMLGQNLIGQSLQAQLGGAASARGGALGQAAAMQQAQQGAAAFQQQGLNQLSGLRAQEMADARNAYMSGSTGMRGQDLSAADMAQRGQMGFETMANESDWRQAQADLQTNQTNAENYRNYQNNRLQAYLGQMGANSAGDARTIDLIKSGVGAGGSMGAAAIIASDAKTKTNVADLSASSNDKGANPLGGFESLVPIAGLGPALLAGAVSSDKTKEDWKKLQPYLSAFSALGMPMAGGVMQPPGASMGFEPSKTIPLMTSDERAKTSIGKAGAELMKEANRSLSPTAYQYKESYTPPDQAPGEVNVGPIAQNMQKSALANTAVKTTPDGTLAIDYGKSLRLALASIGSLQEQVDALSQKKGGKK